MTYSSGIRFESTFLFSSLKLNLFSGAVLSVLPTFLVLLDRAFHSFGEPLLSFSLGTAATTCFLTWKNLWLEGTFRLLKGFSFGPFSLFVILNS